MKKLISVLLAVVFLATALAGCGSGAKDEFQKNVEALKNDAKMNVSFMSVLMNYEAEYMKSNGIEDDTHEAEVAAAANLLYDKSVEQLKASGKDTEAATIESISDRYEEMDKLWQDINGNESGKEKYPELYQEAANLYVTCKSIMGLAIGPYGPGSKFADDSEKLVNFAKETIEKIEGLLNG